METFNWQSCAFLHGEDVFPVSTDALLLAQWVQSKIQFAEHLLDAGCGCGVVGILVSKGTHTVRLTGVDIHPKSIDVTNRNYALNLQKMKAEAHVGEVREHLAIKADVIVSNPPYYLEDIVPDNQDRLRTKHSTITPLEWVSGIEKNLKDGGTVFLVLPSHSVNAWMTAANQCGLYANSRLELYNKRSQTLPVRTLIKLSRNLTSLELTYGSIR